MIGSYVEFEDYLTLIDLGRCIHAHVLQSPIYQSAASCSSLRFSVAKSLRVARCVDAVVDPVVFCWERGNNVCNNSSRTACW